MSSSQCYFSQELGSRRGIAKKYVFYIQYLDSSNACSGKPQWKTIEPVTSEGQMGGVLSVIRKQKEGTNEVLSPGQQEIVTKIVEKQLARQYKERGPRNQSSRCYKKVGGCLCCVSTAGPACAVLVPILVAGLAFMALFYCKPGHIDLEEEKKQRDDAVSFWQQETEDTGEKAGEEFSKTNRSRETEIVKMYSREDQPSGGSKGGFLTIGEPELSTDVDTDSSWFSFDSIYQRVEDFYYRDAEATREVTTEEKKWIEDFETEFCKEMKDGVTPWSENDSAACQSIAHSLAYDYTEEIQEYQTLGILFNLLYSGNLASFVSLGGSYLIEETPSVATSRLYGVPVPKNIAEKLNTEEASTYIREADPMNFYHGIINNIGRDWGADLRPLDYSNYALLDTQLSQSEILALPRGLDKKTTIAKIEGSSTKSSREKDNQLVAPSGSHRLKPYKPAVRQPSPQAKNTIISNIEVNTHEGRIWHDFSQWLTSEITMSGDTRNPETGKFETLIDATKIRDFFPHFRAGFLMMNGQDVGKQNRVDLQQFILEVIRPMKKVILEWIRSDAKMMNTDGKIQRSAQKKMKQANAIRNAFLFGSGIVLAVTASPVAAVGAAVTIGYAFNTDQQNKIEMDDFVKETAEILEKEKGETSSDVLSQTSTPQHQKFKSASTITLAIDKDSTPILELASALVWTNIPLDPRCQMYIEDYLKTYEEIPQVQGLDELGQFFCAEFLIDGANQFGLEYRDKIVPADSSTIRALPGSANTGQYRLDRQKSLSFHYNKSESPNMSQILLEQVSPSSSKKKELYNDTISPVEKQPSSYKSNMKLESFKIKRVYFEKPGLFLEEVLQLKKEDLQERKNLYTKLMARFASVSNFKKTRPELLYALRGPTNIFIKVEAQQPEFGKPWFVKTKNQDSTTPIIEFQETNNILEYIIRYDLYIGRVNLINCLFHPMYYTYFKKLSNVI